MQRVPEGAIEKIELPSLRSRRDPQGKKEGLTQLFTTGYKGFTFWNLVTTIAVLIVVVEAMQYDKMLKEKDKKPNITTLSVFSIIALGLSLITFPTIIQKLKERRILNA